jgi:DNA-binding NtrC family response regulator/predicted hydrocarbon binding protein
MTVRKPAASAAAAILEPDINDLAKRLRFTPQEGRIWLDDQRMLLMHASSLQALRQELIDSLGQERAHGLISRIGYQAGAHDAEVTKKVRAGSDTYSHFLGGPQLVSLEGLVRCEPIALDIDVSAGRYFGAFHLVDCAEAEVHVKTYGIASEGVCWMLTGYACGYTSTFMGRPILWREFECRATGHEKCRVVGQPVEDWDDAARDDLRFLQIGELLNWAGSDPAHRVAGPKLRERHDHTPASTLGLVGISTGFNAVCHKIEKAAPTDATVLFLGESGVGKEIFSRTVHRVSKRSDGPFIAVNCAAIPEALMESELFGVTRGGFTGATASRPGRFERADGGTLFLDEIGTLSWASQGKLLRALQEGEIERVGDTVVRKVDVRVIAATNVDLSEAVRRGEFRQDLFYRINVFPIKVPPLRERRDDIPLMMDWFLQRFCKKYDKVITGFRERGVDALRNYRWPGNIREMENMIERAVILADDGGALDLCHLFTAGEELDASSFVLRPDGNIDSDRDGDSGADAVPVIPVSLSPLADTEVESLRRAMAEAKGNLAQAARLLGISRPTMAYRLRKYGLR